MVPGLAYGHLQIINKPSPIHITRLGRTHREFDVATTLGKGHGPRLECADGTDCVGGCSVGPAPRRRPQRFLCQSSRDRTKVDRESLQIIRAEIISVPACLCFWAEPDGSLHITLVCAVGINLFSGAAIAK